MSQCNFDGRKILLFAYDELEPDGRLAVKNHIESCEMCRHELHDLLAGAGFVNSLPLDLPSRDTLRNIRIEARSRVRKPVPVRIREMLHPLRVILQPVPVAIAATIVIFFCGLVLYRQNLFVAPGNTTTQILKWENDLNSTFSTVSDQEASAPANAELTGVKNGYLASVYMKESEAEFHKRVSEIEESIEFLLDKSPD